MCYKGIIALKDAYRDPSSCKSDAEFSLVINRGVHSQEVLTIRNVMMKFKEHLYRRLSDWLEVRYLLKPFTWIIKRNFNKVVLSLYWHTFNACIPVREKKLFKCELYWILDASLCNHFTTFITTFNYFFSQPLRLELWCLLNF